MTTRRHHVITGIGMAAIVSLTLSGCGNTNAPNTAASNQTGSGGARMTTVTNINETGSSLLYPLFNDQWIPAYTKVAPHVRLSSASTGSGTGISQALAGTVQIGASDAYLSSMQMAQTPHMLNIPLAISAQQIMYHIPGISYATHLHLSGNVIAKMYEGKIQYWDDPAVKSLNHGLKLPHHKIVLVTRSDGSGDTFLFTQFLTATDTSWANQGLVGTTVSFPAVPGEVGAKGNSGVVDTLQNSPYSIGYVGISWLDTATSKGLGYAALMNKSGKFVLPTPQSIQAAASVGSKKIPTDERVSLIYQPGVQSYPIVNFEYAIINQTQQANVVKPLQSFLNWAISPSGGNQAKYLKPVHFLPLPANIAALSKKQIQKIGQ